MKVGKPEWCLDPQSEKEYPHCAVYGLSLKKYTWEQIREGCRWCRYYDKGEK